MNNGIIVPQERLTDGSGIVTKSWWRFFYSLAQTVGASTTSLTLADAITLATINGATPASAPDATLPPPSDAGRIAELELRVRRLETLLELAYGHRPNESRAAEYAAAITLGTH